MPTFYFDPPAQCFLNLLVVLIAYAGYIEKGFLAIPTSFFLKALCRFILLPSVLKCQIKQNPRTPIGDALLIFQSSYLFYSTLNLVVSNVSVV